MENELLKNDLQTTIKEAEETDLSDIFDLIKIECNEFSGDPVIEYDGSENEFRSTFDSYESTENTEEILYFEILYLFLFLQHLI